MDESSNISPRLTKIKRRNPYSVPENYFEELPGRIQEAIHVQKETEPVKPFAFRFIRPQLAIAASIIIFAMLGYLGYKSIYSYKSSIELTSGEIAEYVEYYSSEIDEDLFIELLDENKLPKANFSDLSDEIITYLIDESIDYQSIVEQL